MADDALVASRLNALGEKQHVPDALVVPLEVIMRLEFANRPSQRAFAEQNQAVQTGFLDTPDEALGERIEIR